MSSPRVLPAVPWRAKSFWSFEFWPLSTSFITLLVFGIGDGLVLLAALGGSPWAVLAQGISLHTPLSVGMASLLVSVVALLSWIPLRIRFGINTILNAILISAGIDIALWLVPAPTEFWLQVACCFIGTIISGVCSAFYLCANMGTGPRDGIMVELSMRFGWKIVWVRTTMELLACFSGWLIGGTAGLGTIIFALLVGQALAFTVKLFYRRYGRVEL